MEITEEMLEKVNRFTNSPLSAEDVYIFKVHLCDNDIDRDLEVFSDETLEQLKDLFVGKTGIFDHTAKATNQVARIFDTEVVPDTLRTTKDGRPYKFLQGYAYMVKTSANEDFIKEIDGGIKKEVSVSCSVNTHRCSICDRDRLKEACPHKKGKEYDSQLCYTILDGATDAYEWSFVAVPAQVNAGVTKQFNQGEPKTENISVDNSSLQIARLRIEILKKKGN